ncbi:MAG: hypothetical protein ACHQYP_06275 [Nitrospiria bacterium]
MVIIPDMPITGITIMGDIIIGGFDIMDTMADPEAGGDREADPAEGPEAVVR